LLCLADEQFLNDSIIDFWLRYFEIEILSTVDKEKTYMFSTFFYKRLTTKPKKRPSISNNTPEEDSNLTPAEKRHNRVKRWTKNVDIFEKDFLIIPICEKYVFYYCYCDFIFLRT
jgi:sentrin-specific protease 7